MPERYTPFSNFDKHTVGETLRAAGRTSRDLAHGEGTAFTVGDGKAELETYPEAGVARVTTETARVELFQVPRYSVGKSWVVFEHGDNDDRAGLVVADSGKVSYRPIQGATESPTTSEQESSAPVEQPTPDEAPDSSAPPEEEEREVVTMKGRLGRAPWARLDADNPTRGFLFGHNQTDDSPTQWYMVTARDGAVDQVRDGERSGWLRKGKEVVVTGEHLEPEDRRSKTLPFDASSVTKPPTPARPKRQQS